MFSLSRQFALATVTGAMLAFLCSPVWAADGAIRSIQYDPGTRHFTIDAGGPVKAIVNTLTIAGQKRIIIDVDNAEIGMDLPRDSQLLQELSGALPSLRNVTVNQYGGNGRPIVRILLDIGGEPKTIRLIRNQGPRLELEVTDTSVAQAAPLYQPAPQQPAARPVQQQPQYTEPVNPGSRATGTNADKKKIEDLQTSLSLMNKKYELLQQENQFLKTKATPINNPELDRLRQENARLSSQTSALAVDDLKRTMVRMNEQIGQLSQENRTLKSENAQLKTQAAEAPAVSEPDLSNLRKQLTLAQQSMNDSIRTINEQNKEIAYLRNQVAEVKTGMDVSAREQISKLQSLSDEKDIRIRDLERQLAVKNPAPQTDTAGQTELANLKRQLNQLTTQYKSAVEDWSQQAKTKNQQIQELDTQLVTLRQQARQTENLQQQVASLQSQLNAAKTLPTQTTAPAQELQKRDAQIATLQKEISAFKATAASSSASNQEVQKRDTQIIALQREVAGLKTALAAKPQASVVDDGEISGLKDEIARLMKENTELKEMPRQASPAAAEQTRILQQQVVALEEQLAAAKKAAAAKPAAATPAPAGGAAALQKQVADLNKQMGDLRRENTSLKDRLASTGAVGKRTPSSNQEAEQDYTDAKALMVTGDIAKALEKYKEAQLLDPDNARFTLDYSIALAESRQYAEAADLLRLYLQRNPGDREAYNQLGKIYLLNDQTDAANQAFSRAISVSTLNNYATSLKKLNKMEEAEGVFKLALTINPNDSEVLFNLGNLYNATNKTEQARNNYLQAIQIRPDFAEAHYNLGLIYSKLGDKTKAVSHLEKFLQLSPNARNAETIRVYVEKLKV